MMKRSLSGAIAFLFLAISMWAGPRAAQWAQVEDAAKAGLPKTASAELDPIIAGALADQSYPEAIKAIVRKIEFEGEIQGHKPEEKIVRLQAEMEKSPAAMHPMMEAILAHWYWEYFERNRWRFLQRTQTEAAPGPDFQTWSLAQILAEIDKHVSAALGETVTLEATPIGAYDDLLVKGSVPDLYRPTVFDFLVNDALQFYQAGEQAGAAAEDEFEAAAGGPIFDDAAEFMGWRLETTATASAKREAIGLYQALLNFHEHDADRSAFYDADLSRLAFAHNIAVGDDRDERYKAALRRFIAATSAHEISARAQSALAAQLEAEGDPAGAHEAAERGLAAFPESSGGAMCYNLINQIEAKSVRLDTESVWNPPWPTLNVTYRNLTKVYFRVVAADFTTAGQGGGPNFGFVDRNRFKELLARPAALVWEADLPPTRDFKERTERLPAPGSLKPGFYFILAGDTSAMAESEDQVNVASIWVTDLALVIRTRFSAATQSGFVLRANGGEPVAGATVRLWERDTQGRFEPIAPVKTDQNGEFQFASTLSAAIVLAEFGGQAVSSVDEIYGLGGGVARPNAQTAFFTDRAIYRPGQTVGYKGVSVSSDPHAGNYSAAAGLALTVVFSDVNGQEIARATQRTNDYGSFSGTFTAPRDRLTGRMSIRVLDQPGAAYFQVEEYKRPKFQTELNPPAEVAKLGAVVDVTGKATAYTGAPIGGSKVKWRVARDVRCPSWCWWWQPSAAKAIAHGTAVTGPDGTFNIEFSAEPDRAVPVKNEPVFVFSVYADVTDTTGETRSGERLVRAGYTALQASLSADNWQTPDKPVDFSVATKSLDDDPQPASGTLTVYALKQSAAVERAPLESGRDWRRFDAAEPAVDPANPDSWALGAVVDREAFKTDSSGKTDVAARLKAGIYRVALETKDRFGKPVTARQTFEVVDSAARHYGVKIPNYFAASKWSVEPGETFTALWGTGYGQGRAFVELECDGKLLKSYWTAANWTQELVKQPVTEAMRGGITLRITYVRENRAYLNEQIINVPWSNKQLTVQWESFRSKLVPGQKETWMAVVTGPDAKRAPAEMAAALYDASLDQYRAHDWPRAFGVFRRESASNFARFENTEVLFRTPRSWKSPAFRDPNWTYRALPIEDRRFGPIGGAPGVIQLEAFEVFAAGAKGYFTPNTFAGTRLDDISAGEALAGSNVIGDIPSSITIVDKASLSGPVLPQPDIEKVAARTNLAETAFFFPQLLAGADGVIKIVFTIPDALTEWKFLGFAHDKQLRSGFLTDKVVTAKDLMVEPNPPRFVREGDTIEFTVKVTNQTESLQSGTVRLTFADAATQHSVDAALGNLSAAQPFAVPAKQARTYSWPIAVPEGLGFLTYKAVAAGAKYSDGEEGYLPVLSRKVLLTESLPLPIRGPATKSFEFQKLLDSGESGTLRQQSLTVQMVSQPSWYAVMALPYLMEYPYECSEQVFNRLYANALARHIANSDPKIRHVFDLWKNTSSLDSPLEKNQDLKSVMIEETPWLRQAKSESAARRNVGLLFDANRLDEETARTLLTLSQQQLSGGLWPWFPGGPPSEYISLYIMTGFGRLRHLGVEVNLQPALNSLAALDEWMDDRYRRIREAGSSDDYVPNDTEALYLYGRSFFITDHPVANEHREALDYFLRQARKSWLKVGSLQSQAHLALALQRFGDLETPLAIMKSLKERSVDDAELGLFWRDLELSQWWYRAPIETQALMIEAFAEVAHDSQAVEDCKVWLLKQKQTQDWRTTTATADAIYGLLLRGTDLLASDALVEVDLAGDPVKPDKVEVGTGFYERKFVRDEIKPAMGRITVKKNDEGVSWGSVCWQYLEDIAKVTPHTGTGLKLKKTLWIKETTGRGQVLKAVTGPVSVGDELVVRIELRSDRDLEFVHLKDQRGSGTEPVDVLSQYRYHDGLAYYESTRDAASHFFIDYLPKGVYVFEYSTLIQLKGRYQTGVAEVQCMYAPEFSSHSESIALEVK